MEFYKFVLLSMAAGFACGQQYVLHPEFQGEQPPPPPQEHFILPPPQQHEQNFSSPYPPQYLNQYPGPVPYPAQPVFYPGAPPPYPQPQQPYPAGQYNYTAPPPYPYPAYYPYPSQPFSYPTAAPPLPPGFNSTTPYPYPVYPGQYPPPGVYAPQPYPPVGVPYYGAPYLPQPYPGVPVYYGTPIPGYQAIPQSQPQAQITSQVHSQPSSKPHYRVFGIPSVNFLQVSTNTTTVAYSGFIIELLDALAGVLDFSYSFSVQPDKMYGTRTADGSWNGLVRSVIEGKCDFAAADLSVTAARESVLDFTLPFYQYSMQMLINKQFPPNGNGFSYLIRNNADADFIKQSTNPRDQTIWDNLTKNFPGSFVESEKEGIEKVLSGPFAFIMESPGIQSAIASSNGQMEKSPEVFPSSYYSFAVPVGSPLREKLSFGVATLLENGQLYRMINKYLS